MAPIKGRSYSVREFVLPNGICPYRNWLTTLDTKIRAKIQARISRVEQGNFGDFKWVAEGVYELRFNIGKGYRVYFGLRDPDVVVILSGGDKGSQKMDIVRAKYYWKNIKSAN